MKTEIQLKKLIMSKFKVGDKVSVQVLDYTYKTQWKMRTIKGTVLTIESNVLLVQEKSKNAFNYAVTPRQCRRLVKKETKKIYIHPDRFTGSQELHIRIGSNDFSYKPFPEAIEFVEVKKKLEKINPNDPENTLKINKMIREFNKK